MSIPSLFTLTAASVAVGGIFALVAARLRARSRDWAEWERSSPSLWAALKRATAERDDLRRKLQVIAREIGAPDLAEMDIREVELIAMARGNTLRRVWGAA